MGSEDALRVAVVTPYYREPEDVLRQCLTSVAEQSYPCTHFLVADGHPQEIADRVDEHIVLSGAHQDCGNLARSVGSLSAMSRGFDAITYLDADNWYRPDHIASMVALHQSTGAAVCSASRTIHRQDGSLMFEDLESDGRRHVDTNCLFLTRSAFRAVPAWAMMPTRLSGVGDRVVWGVIQAHGYSTAHNSDPTVSYRTIWQVHYQAIGEAPPPGAKSNADVTQLAYDWWHSQTAEEQQAWSQQLGVTIPW